jgi:prepilin-type N-terminal cleavage/methylation domain-containing protein
MHQPADSLRSLPAAPRAGRRGFTLTELLVVVAIIVLLLGTLFVALNAASRRAQGAKTQFLMSSIATGLGQFQTDFGYLPPVLMPRDTGAPGRGLGRDVTRLDQIAGANVFDRQQRWVSYTTLADFLVGYGNRSEDGYGIVAGAPAGAGNREAPPFGIRSPGPDGCWGAVDAPQPAFSANPNFLGFYRARNPSRSAQTVAINNLAWNGAALEGKVYGPYLDAVDERLLGGITGFDASGRPTIVTADQGVPNFDDLPKTLLDYWGEPIAYHRAPYEGTDLRSSKLSPAGGFMGLGDVFILRDWEIDPNEVSVGAADANGDDSSSATLKGAAFALLSEGPDRASDRNARRDQAEVNKDNVVLTGK